ncbi:MAG: GNAT family N-acetyltransferase [Myxococcota bacterium]
MNMIYIATSSESKDLLGILELQSRNLRGARKADDLSAEGFVTLVHDLPLLQDLGTNHLHVVAKAGDTVVGYALVMERAFAPRIPELTPLFEHIDGLEYRGTPLAKANYVVMGQVCIDRAYRGQGLFRRLYAAYGDQLRPHFDYVVTEISGLNHRSRDAHLGVGFEILEEYSAPDGSPWTVVLWALGSAEP